MGFTTSGPTGLAVVGQELPTSHNFPHRPFPGFYSSSASFRRAGLFSPSPATRCWRLRSVRRVQGIAAEGLGLSTALTASNGFAEQHREAKRGLLTRATTTRFTTEEVDREHVMDVNTGRRHLIKEVEFIKSSPRESDCPQDGLPEFALVGRSNVGKSSLVNALVNRKEMAQTSKRPGKTQLINHFRINKSWYLVDLPGYGYAKAPVAVKTEWNDFTKSYFLNRKTLVAVMLLVDASIPPLQIDLDCADWLGRNKIPVTIVFTKCDRRKKRKNGGKPPDENVADFERQLQESYSQTPPWVMTSSVSGQGKDELLKHMARLLDYWSK